MKKKTFGVLAVAAVIVIVTAAVHLGAQAAPPPPWAYGFTTPPPPPPPAGQPAAGGRGGGGGRGAGAAAPVDTTLHSLAGSDKQFTLTQIRDGFGPADWFPGDHPVMPAVVSKGRMPDVRACALCHYPNGKGRPENAGIAGLPNTYFIQQLVDFKNDNRKSADPRKNNTNIMIAIAKAMTDEEIKAAAEYFGSMKWTPWIAVRETPSVPTPRIAGGMFLSLGNGTSEPIGDRIIEMPEKTENTETLRDPRSGFVGYVPMGSIKKGEDLVTTGGNGKTTKCAVCHGLDLKGLGPVPGLAGRSPSYTARQLYDMQSGSRKGLWTDLMKPVVANLTNDDLLAIAAYTASRTP